MKHSKTIAKAAWDVADLRFLILSKEIIYGSDFITKGLLLIGSDHHQYPSALHIYAHDINIP